MSINELPAELCRLICGCIKDDNALGTLANLCRLSPKWLEHALPWLYRDLRIQLTPDKCLPFRRMIVPSKNMRKNPGFKLIKTMEVWLPRGKDDHLLEISRLIKENLITELEPDNVTSIRYAIVSLHLCRN